ncbi:MAG: hypothetical protein UV78_C0010G0005 [Parcubacteria group bacterium GW2011_GWA2_43_17]|nr:MAG: hypothetical protein UV78_C0010G0005 [Parcubacteria group bacterium GW2011_GWA2_43_17]
MAQNRLKTNLELCLPYKRTVTYYEKMASAIQNYPMDNTDSPRHHEMVTVL